MFLKIHRKAPVSESLFNKVAGLATLNIKTQNDALIHINETDMLQIFFNFSIKCGILRGGFCSISVLGFLE